MKLIGKIAILVFIVFWTLFLLYYLFLPNFKPTIAAPEIIEPEVVVAEIIEPILIENKSVINALPALRAGTSQATLLAVGDIMLSRSVEELMIRKNDWTLPFKMISDLTAKADITFGNLETAILPGRAIAVNEFTFRADPKALAGLKISGFDLVALANNHTPNFGQNGLKTTFEELDKAGIKYVGAGINQTRSRQPVIIEKNGIKFGFLSYAYASGVASSYFADKNRAGVNPLNLENLKFDLKELKPQVDFVIILIHAGVEYQFKPSKQQIDFAQAAIDNGASIVIGSHPHVVQTLEKYKNGYIFYSLGNFIFDQMWSEPTREGLMVKMVFNKNQILQLEPLPIYINKSYQPALANQKISEKIFSILNYPLEKQSKYFWTNENFKLSVSQGIYNKYENSENKYQSFDLDGDGNNEEAVVIDKVGYLIKDNKIIWKTEESWIVDNVLIGDYNNDQKPEVGFSLWKEGSYGPSKPFWVKDNDTKISNHLFLYQLELEKLSSLSSFKMIWGSSALDFPIKEMKLGDFDNDGKNELAVLESNCGRYEQKCEKNNLGIWRWGNFSFYKIFKGEVGKSIDFFFFDQ